VARGLAGTTAGALGNAATLPYSRRRVHQRRRRLHADGGASAAHDRQMARGTDSRSTTSTQSPQHKAPHSAHGPAATAWQYTQ
jgi:hypothetical protein